LEELEVASSVEIDGDISMFSQLIQKAIKQKHMLFRIHHDLFNVLFISFSNWNCHFGTAANLGVACWSMLKSVALDASLTKCLQSALGSIARKQVPL
jgi:hypothetical protein